MKQLIILNWFCPQAGDVPVEFEEFHLSEVQNMASEEKLDHVFKSIKNNKVALKGSYALVMLIFYFYLITNMSDLKDSKEVYKILN